MCRLLHVCVYGGEDHISIVVSRIPKTLDHLLTDHFGHIIGIHLDYLTKKACAHGRIACRDLFGFCDLAEAGHSAQNPVAPNFAFIRVAQGVIAGGCLGYAGQHGVLRQAEVGKGFAVVGFGSRLESVGPVPQEHAIDIEFKNLSFRQRLFDF